MDSSNKDGQVAKCPNCGATYFYLTQKIEADGTVQCHNCAMWLSVPSKPEQDKGAVVSIAFAKEAAAHVRITRPIRDFSIKRDLPTALYHGLYFTLAILASFWMWIYVNYFATLSGSPIGFYVGIVIMSFGIVEVVGYMNVFLVQNLWDVYCRRDWTHVFSHGAVLSLLLLAILYPATFILPVLSTQSVDVYAAAIAGMVLLYWVAIGLIGRFVAYLFVVDKPET